MSNVIRPEAFNGKTAAHAGITMINPVVNETYTLEEVELAVYVSGQFRPIYIFDTPQGEKILRTEGLGYDELRNMKGFATASFLCLIRHGQIVFKLQAKTEQQSSASV